MRPAASSETTGVPGSSCCQSLQDDGFGRLIGRRDRRAIGFCARVERAGADRHNCAGGPRHQARQVVQQAAEAEKAVSSSRICGSVPVAAWQAKSTRCITPARSRYVWLLIRIALTVRVRHPFESP